MAKDEDLRLFDLLERETDPELRRVLEHYRAAEVEMQCAAEQLGKMQRTRWQLAALSYSRDIELQAQRHMAIERARKPKLSDFRDDLPTNPSGYPAFRPALQQPVATERKREQPPAPKPPLVIKPTKLTLSEAQAIVAATPPRPAVIPPLPAGYSFGTMRLPAVPKAVPKTIEVDLDDLLPADTIASDEAVFDTERPPALASDRYVMWVINLVLTFIIVFTLWLLRREVTPP